MAETRCLAIIDEEEIEVDDDIYENIEAPKFVDLTAPDSRRPDDDRHWFCFRVGNFLLYTNTFHIFFQILTHFQLHDINYVTFSNRMWPKAWARVGLWGNLQEFCSSGMFALLFFFNLLSLSQLMVMDMNELILDFQVMAARSPNVRLRKALNRREAR